MIKSDVKRFTVVPVYKLTENGVNKNSGILKLKLRKNKNIKTKINNPSPPISIYNMHARLKKNLKELHNN